MSLYRNLTRRVPMRRRLIVFQLHSEAIPVLDSRTPLSHPLTDFPRQLHVTLEEFINQLRGNFKFGPIGLDPNSSLRSG
ncbi:hypothetical protein [Streptomyces sp. PsTaAH-124]|uniref:hypothetical protein n=1 Tax=Streptomyces sp. PsTaAH-124 TaxID=1157638 RepID=UPI0018F8B13C|nr:hypothetical protein [Streptomyces sp. PsTaAH-124]